MVNDHFKNILYKCVTFYENFARKVFQYIKEKITLLFTAQNKLQLFKQHY